MIDMGNREVLAPAGTYECFRAAINAGADAVYLGGSMFGARAFAGNFEEAELIKAIRTAHLYGRKVYLTVNTLLRNDELEKLVQYVKPYYEEGLDAVIVQDYGVFAVLREAFPGLDLHASTQMTITGKYGAQLLNDMGAARVVPARELSAKEIRDIYDNVDVEIESFVHGALCYCYSGQCLLSSMIGGRSGNRGRCAQPCRLTYSANGISEKYLLSPKDMCTIEAVPDILDAGVYSLKIEGRMKTARMGAGTLVGISSCKIVGQQASSRIRDAHRSVNKGLDFHLIRNMLPDFPDFFQGQLSCRHNALCALLVPELIRSVVRIVCLSTDMPLDFRADLHGDAVHARIGDNERVRPDLF